LILPKHKKVLKYLYITTHIKKEEVKKNDIAEYIEEPLSTAEEIIDFLIKEKYITNRFNLTNKGRKQIKVGLIGGVFDIVHIGHIATLKEARSKVDVLAVVIARDKTVEKFKNRKPVIEEKDRKEIIQSIRYVDIAILGSEEDFIKPVEKINPDIIFLGYDQILPPNLAKKIPPEMICRLNVRINDIKTTAIIQRIKEAGL
jgi:cytidyltransferase-like protein